MRPFTLTKWYLDCVDDDGHLTIVYWARLGWRGLALTSTSVISAGTRSVSSTTGVSSAPPPQFADGVLRFQTRDLAVEMHGRAPSYTRGLFAGPEGSVDWNCAIPCGEVSLSRKERVHRGLGYAERIELTIAPWKLPIDELRWGRFTSQASSMAWIDWSGAAPLTLVLRDGVAVDDGEVTDRLIRAGDLAIDLSEERVVRDARLGSTLEAIPSIQRLLPDRLLNASEKKWCNRSTLRRGSDALAEGWSVHERVRFR